MIVQSFGALQAPGELSRSTYDTGRSSSLLGLASTYAEIYRTQPNVRTVVDFLARNVAHLALHAFRRVSDTDRVRLATHDVVQWLAAPNPATSRYRLFEALMQDLGTYLNAWWLKLRRPDRRIGLVRLPPESMSVTGWLLPSAYIWTTPDGVQHPLDPADVCYFGGYDPCDPLLGLSPIETLRRRLSADAASTAYQESYYDNAARIEGVIERPATAPKWTTEQKQSFREQWQARFAGPANAGQTAVLEDGMTFKTTAHSPRDSEFTAARKLTREEVAAAYHVPLPMVGILDHATFSNIKEQHKQLYQDCLGPWLEHIQEEIERQLLPESTDREDIYLEFNIAEKLKGSFEEQADSLRKLVGRPVMTANEARARLNLPSITDDPTADQLALPLNTSTGAASDAPPLVPDTTATAAIVRRTWMRQRARLDKVDQADRPGAFETARWDRELAEELEPLYQAVGCTEAEAARASAALACSVNHDTLQLLVAGEDAFSSSREAALYR